MYNWLYKLIFKYKNINKYVFVNKYKQLNIIETCKKFLNIMKNLKPYLVKFEENELIKAKNYLDNCIIKKDIHHFIIIIT